MRTCACAAREPGVRSEKRRGASQRGEQGALSVASGVRTCERRCRAGEQVAHDGDGARVDDLAGAGRVEGLLRGLVGIRGLAAVLLGARGAEEDDPCKQGPHASGFSVRERPIWKARKKLTSLRSAERPLRCLSAAGWLQASRGVALPRQLAATEPRSVCGKTWLTWLFVCAFTSIRRRVIQTGPESSNRIQDQKSTSVKSIARMIARRAQPQPSS